MEYLQIPLPDFSFEDIAVDTAKNIIKFYLYDEGIGQYISGSNDELISRMERDIDELFEKNEKLICIIHLLNYLIQNVITMNGRNGLSDDNKQWYSKGVNKIKYHLYRIASLETNYKFDKNSFSDDEIVDLNQKINAIVSKLDEVKIGQEVIYNSIDELKEDFDSLKTDFVLGKKKWGQRATGMIVSYTGHKGADTIFDLIKPELKNLFVHHLVPVVDKLLGL